MGIVTSVAVSVNSDTLGADLATRIQDAMNAAVLQCNAEGISTAEENSVIIKERMMAAYARVMAEIEAERG